MKDDDKVLVFENVHVPRVWQQDASSNFQIFDALRLPFLYGVPEGHSFPDSITYEEPWNPLKKIQQWRMKRKLNPLKEEILRNHSTILHVRWEAITMESLDEDLTLDTNAYVWRLAEYYVQFCGYESPEWKTYAQALYTSREQKRIKENIRSVYWQHKIQEKINFSIACVIDRTWAPRKNIQRFERAQKFYEDDDVEISLEEGEDYLDYLEAKVYANPFYRYVKQKGEHAV